MPEQNRPVREFMTALPHTVEVTSSVSAASQRMTALGVRHLPVVDDKGLVGVLSDRDIQLVTGVAKVAPDQVRVGDVMEPNPITATPDTPLAEVVRGMAESKMSSAIVKNDSGIQGILTTSDLMDVFSMFLLGLPTHRGMDPAQSEVRSRILAEHRVLRRLLTQSDALAARVQQGNTDATAQLQAQCRELLRTLGRHLDLEDKLLAPALENTDAFGEERSKQMLAGHSLQREVLSAALKELDQADQNAHKVADDVRELIRDIRADMKSEEETLLHKDLLRDDIVSIDASGD